MIRLVERVLNIEAGISKIYKYGYKNNHATYEPPQDSKKRRERDYDQNELAKYDQHGSKRPRLNDTQSSNGNY